MNRFPPDSLRLSQPTLEGIRERILRAIARDRVPGFHFAGHFFEIAFGSVEPNVAVTSMPVPSHCTDSAGNVHVSVLGLLADVALAAGIRAGLGKIGRLATVSIDLRLSS